MNVFAVKSYVTTGINGTVSKGNQIYHIHKMNNKVHVLFWFITSVRWNNTETLQWLMAGKEHRNILFSEDTIKPCRSLDNMQEPVLSVCTGSGEQYWSWGQFDTCHAILSNQNITQFICLKRALTKKRGTLCFTTDSHRLFLCSNLCWWEMSLSLVILG